MEYFNHTAPTISDRHHSGLSVWHSATAWPQLAEHRHFIPQVSSRVKACRQVAVPKSLPTTTSLYYNIAHLSTRCVSTPHTTVSLNMSTSELPTPSHLRCKSLGMNNTGKVDRVPQPRIWKGRCNFGARRREKAYDNVSREKLWAGGN